MVKFHDCLPPDFGLCLFFFITSIKQFSILNVPGVASFHAINIPFLKTWLPSLQLGNILAHEPLTVSSTFYADVTNIPSKARFLGIIPFQLSKLKSSIYIFF